MLSIVVDSPVSGQLLTIAIVFPFFNLHGFKVGDVVKCSEVWVFIVPWYFGIIVLCTLHAASLRLDNILIFPVYYRINKQVT